jgi:hypothetical protein
LTLINAPGGIFQQLARALPSSEEHALALRLIDAAGPLPRLVDRIGQWCVRQRFRIPVGKFGQLGATGWIGAKGNVKTRGNRIEFVGGKLVLREAVGGGKSHYRFSC